MKGGKESIKEEEVTKTIGEEKMTNVRNLVMFMNKGLKVNLRVMIMMFFILLLKNIFMKMRKLH